MLKLEKGRPADCAGRLEKEIQTYDFLDKLNIEYERIDHEAAMTMEECADVDEALGAMICKNLFLCNRQETTFYLLMIPGDKKFKTKDLSAQIGSSRLSFAKETYMEEFLDTSDAIRASTRPAFAYGRKICGKKLFRRWNINRSL